MKVSYLKSEYVDLLVSHCKSDKEALRRLYCLLSDLKVPMPLTDLCSCLESIISEVSTSNNKN